MLYAYRSLNPQGKLVLGEVDAPNERAAARQLRRDNLRVLELRESEVEKKRRRSSSSGPEELQLVFYQFASLLESGIALEVAAASLADSVGDMSIQEAFQLLTKRIRGGMAFSVALRETKLKLPGYFYSLSESGEMTGKLPQALRRGVDQWAYELESRRELKNALIYPAILVVSGILAVLLIFVMVVPKFVNLLDKAQGEIPLLAQIVLGTGKFFNDNIIGIGVVVVVAGIAAVVAFSKPENVHKARQLLYRAPLAGEWLIESAIGRWASLLATLLDNRVELTQALRLAEKDMEHDGLKAQLQQVEKSVRSGDKLAESLLSTRVLTDIGYNLVKVGEQTGQLPKMLYTLGEMHENQGKQRMKKFLIMLEPVAILLIGGAIGFIMGGIILAITSINDVAI